MKLQHNHRGPARLGGWSVACWSSAGPAPRPDALPGQAVVGPGQAGETVLAAAAEPATRQPRRSRPCPPRRN